MKQVEITGKINILKRKKKKELKRAKSQIKTEEEIKLEGVIEDIGKFEESMESWVEMVMVFELIEKFYELHGHELRKIKTILS